MKKAVIAVVAVLVFIFTLTQKSEAVTAANWPELSNYLSGYSTDPIELSADITSVGNFSTFYLPTNKKITSTSGNSLSLTFSPPPQTQLGILALNNKKLEFQKLNVLTFSSATYSAIKNETLSLITFDTLTVKFSSNSADYGGAIYNSGSSVSFTNATINFLYNTANNVSWWTEGDKGSGGAIYNQGSTVSFTNSTVDFSSNSAYVSGRSGGSGGAIYNSGSSVSFTNSTVNFLYNTANNNSWWNGGGYGGAIFNWESAVSFVNSTVDFSNNSAGYVRGGAIYNQDATISFVNSTVDFSSNSAGYYYDEGGAIFNRKSTASFVNSTVDFSYNKADEGGAIFNRDAIVSFINSTVSFVSNTAEDEGGAIFSSNSITSFTNSTVSFVSNTAYYYGGAIYNQGSTVSFVNSTVSFVSNTADHPWSGGAGAIYNQDATVSFVNSTVDFSSNSAGYHEGGAIFNSGSTVSFVNSTVDFSYNSVVDDDLYTKGGQGGAIFNSGSTVSFVNSTVSFVANSARSGGYGGGAIYNSRSSVSFVNSTVSFLANSATYGGAIYNQESPVSFVNSTVDFLYNTALGGGGAIYADAPGNSSIVSFINSSVTFAENRGGAIYVASNSNAKLNIEGSIATFIGNTGSAIYATGNSTVSFINSSVTFSANTAAGFGFGGAIYATGNSTVSFINSSVTFTQNYAGNGGAIYNSGLIVSFVNSTVSFLSNTAEDAGGAIYNSGSIVSFDNSIVSFSNNSADNDVYGYYSHGGAIYNLGSTVSFVNSIVSFLSNTAEDAGGAIYNYGTTYNYGTGGSSVSFVNSTVSFSGNSAKLGGAIYNENSQLVFNNSSATFLNNTATVSGGAIYSDKSTVSFVNSTVSFSGNSAKSGGAIYNENSQLAFNNSSVTFLNNTATTNGGIFYNLRSTVSFTNSTVFFLNDKKPTNSDISNTDSFISFNNSTAVFINTISDTRGGEYLIDHSQLVFNNATAIFDSSTLDFLDNLAAANAGGTIYNQSSTITFRGSNVNFSGNSVEQGGSGGAIFNDVDSTLIFKGGSKVIFEGNFAPQGKGADIYNDGIIEISERSEVILRSGIWSGTKGNPSEGGVINIKSGGVLTISADEIFISTLNVYSNVYSTDTKFSLVDREAINKANFVTLYTTKTAHIDNLIVEGILEIGVDLSSDNRNDLIDAANSITFIQGSFLNIVPFNAWSSPKTYSMISTGELIGFEKLSYNRSFYVLEYDEQTKTLSLAVINDPALPPPHYSTETPDFIKAVSVANTIRQLSKFDDSSIYENVNENYWGVVQIGSAELKDSVDGKFGANTTGVKAGAAVIKKENLKAGIYAGYDFGETSQKTDKAEFSAFQVGVYASFLQGNINFKALSAYQATTVKAKNGDFSSDFGINNINFGLSAELQTGKIWSPYISLVGSSISSDEISQGTEDFTLAIDAKSYFTLTSKTGVQVKTKAKSVTLRAKGFLGAVLIGNDPEFDLTLTNNSTKETIASSAIPSSEQPLFFGIEGGIDLPLTRQIALAITAQTNFNPDYFAYQASVGVKYSFFGGRSTQTTGNERGKKGKERERQGTTTANCHSKQQRQTTGIRG